MVGLPKSLCKKQVNVQRQEQLTETVNLRRKKKKKKKKKCLPLSYTNPGMSLRFQVSR